MKFSRRIENLIANFRSLPEDDSRSTIRQPCKVDSILEVILEKHQIGQPRPEEMIIKNWKHIVGAKNAPRCSPQRIVRHTSLIIQIANPTLRQEMTFQKSLILNRIRRLPRCERIREIYFKTG